VNSPRTGTYEVHLGLYRPANLPFKTTPPQLCPVPPGRLELQTLSTDAAQLAGPDEMNKLTGQEVFMGVATLGKGRLILSQGRGDYKFAGGFPCYLDYIRLVPLKNSQTGRARRALAGRASARVVGGIFDTFDWTVFNSTRDRATVEEVLKKHLACGFNRIYYKAGGACWEYPSRVKGAQPRSDYPGSIARVKWPGDDLAPHFNEINRLHIAAEFARAHDLEFYPWIRISNQKEHFDNGYPLDGFYLDHPQFREKYRYGQAKLSLCLAYPEVKAHLFRIVKEISGYGVNGFLIDFLRTPPNICFSDLLVRKLKKLYGVDPRKRPPEDPRVIALQCQYLTEFLRDLKKILDTTGTGLKLHVRLDALDRRKGWDVTAWLREKLVDGIIIEHTASFDPGEPPDLQKLLALRQGTACQVIAGFYRAYWGKDHSRGIHEEIIRAQTEKYFQLGADGVSFYETAEVLLYPRMRQAVRRINHQDLPYSIINH
jgi:hypothetical protein